MATDSRKSLLDDLQQTLTEDSDKRLIKAYAKNFDYSDLERAFREQLTEEVSQPDEN